MSNSEDLHCIERILKGQLADFERLMRKYQQFAFTIAYRTLKDKEEAEEACQDAFLKAYRQLARFKQTSKFSTWLYTIVYRCALDRLGKQKLTVVDVEPEWVGESTIELETAFDVLAHKEKTAMVNRGLDQLKGEEASLLTMYYFDELSLKEISAIVDLNTNHLKILLYRARKKLAGLLEKELTNHEIVTDGKKG